jgi:hypothetical protein
MKYLPNIFCTKKDRIWDTVFFAKLNLKPLVLGNFGSFSGPKQTLCSTNAIFSIVMGMSAVLKYSGLKLKSAIEGRRSDILFSRFFEFLNFSQAFNLSMECLGHH